MAVSEPSEKRGYYHGIKDLGYEDLGPGDLNKPDWPIFLFQDYNRLGNSEYTDEEWLEKWLSHDITYWKWPKHDGFLLDNAGQPLYTIVNLGAGMLIDRFGGDNSAFFAQYGTPYNMRSLPPNTMERGYRVFMVKEPFQVKAGPCAPWFDQMGYCLQFLATDYTNVKDMINDGIIKELDPEECRNLFAGKLEEKHEMIVRQFARKPKEVHIENA